MLTHRSIGAAIDGARARIEFVPDEEVVYVFLPLAHVLTRLVQMAAIDAGAQLAYWQGDPKKIVADVAEVVADDPAVGAAHLREDLRGGDGQGRGRRRREGEALLVGGRRRAQGPRARGEGRHATA